MWPIAAATINLTVVGIAFAHDVMRGIHTNLYREVDRVSDLLIQAAIWGGVLGVVALVIARTRRAEGIPLRWEEILREALDDGGWRQAVEVCEDDADGLVVEAPRRWAR